MLPVKVSREILKVDLIIRIRIQLVLQLFIGIEQSRLCCWSRMTAESKSLQHYTPDIFLIGIPVHTKLERMVIITKLEMRFCFIISRDIMIIIEEPVLKGQCGLSAEIIRVIVTE